MFPVLEDANSIQVAIMDIMNDLRYDHIDPKLAGKLLYALQIASYNLKRMDLERQDTIQDLPADWHPIEPKNLPRWGYVKLPYDGEPDPTLPNYKPASPAPDPAQTPSPSERHPERECAPKREALGAIESKDLAFSDPQRDGFTNNECLVSGHDFSRAETVVEKSGASAPAQTPAKQSPPSRKRPSKSSTDSMPSLPAIEQKIARAKAGNVRAARELFELTGLLPRQ